MTPNMHAGTCAADGEGDERSEAEGDPGPAKRRRVTDPVARERWVVVGLGWSSLRTAGIPVWPPTPDTPCATRCLRVTVTRPRHPFVPPALTQLPVLYPPGRAARGTRAARARARVRAGRTPLPPLLPGRGGAEAAGAAAAVAGKKVCEAKAVSACGF